MKLCLHFSYTGHNYFHFDEFCYLTATENEATEKMEMESENVVQDTEVMEIDTKIVEKSPEKPAQVVAKKEVKIPVVKELDEKQKYALNGTIRLGARHRYCNLPSYHDILTIPVLSTFFSLVADKQGLIK